MVSCLSAGLPTSPPWACFYLLAYLFGDQLGFKWSLFPPHTPPWAVWSFWCHSSRGQQPWACPQAPWDGGALAGLLLSFSLTTPSTVPWAIISFTDWPVKFRLLWLDSVWGQWLRSVLSKWGHWPLSPHFSGPLGILQFSPYLQWLLSF